MSALELIYYISGSILYILLICGFIWFLASLFCVLRYERKIEELHKELEIKIQKEKERLASMPAIERRIKNLREEYEPKIEELNRRRQFILDKLPFIK